jgi:hypothetical protein
MYDFIERAHRISGRGDGGWAEESFDAVLQARRRLQVAYAKSNIDLDNIENLFTTFEMAHLVGKLGNLPEDVVEELPSHLRFVIMRTLEQSVLYSIDSDDALIRPPWPYEHFSELLIELGQSKGVAPIAIISFNYDLCLEYALSVCGVDIDYGLPAAPKPKRDSIRLYKVHGSLNWRLEPNSHDVTAVPVSPLPTRHYWDRFGLDSPAERAIDTMELLEGPGAWGGRIHPTPVIVPPTWNKGVYQEMLKTVWREASAAFASAENIFVIGYSLPVSDQFFRSFYALSTISDSIVERFWLFDPAPGQEICDRFGSLLGPAILGRSRFMHHRVRFAKAIGVLADAFNVPHRDIEDR